MTKVAKGPLQQPKTMSEFFKSQPSLSSTTPSTQQQSHTNDTVENIEEEAVDFQNRSNYDPVKIGNEDNISTEGMGGWGSQMKKSTNQKTCFCLLVITSIQEPAGIDEGCDRFAISLFRYRGTHSGLDFWVRPRLSLQGCRFL